jgi:aryl-alcohol dehydrogenase-like predicted oxidoreductase
MASPRFQGENLDAQPGPGRALRALAQERATSVAQLAIAWVAAQGDGHRAAGRRALAAIERAVPKGAAAGERYAAAQMASLDSERARG